MSTQLVSLPWTASHPVEPDAARRVWADYVEMPGLKLTVAQGRRLWNLDEEICSTVLDELVDNGFLMKTRTGSYLRRATAV